MTALVDLNVVLGSTVRADLEVGAWVNVIGYIERVVKVVAKSKHGQLAFRNDGHVEAQVQVQVHAVMIWGAGALKIQQYEKIVEDRVAFSTLHGA